VSGTGIAICGHSPPRAGSSRIMYACLTTNSLRISTLECASPSIACRLSSANRFDRPLLRLYAVGISYTGTHQRSAVVGHGSERSAGRLCAASPARHSVSTRFGCARAEAAEPLHVG
jgi:hypothetical protein